MINTPLEAYEQLAEGDLVLDDDGQLFKVWDRDLMRFGDDCTVAIKDAASSHPFPVTFPLRKVIVVAADALRVAGPIRQWKHGDIIPAEVISVIDREGDRWHRAPGGWIPDAGFSTPVRSEPAMLLNWGPVRLDEGIRPREKG